MNKAGIVLGVMFLEIVVSVSGVESAEPKNSNLACNIWKQETLTNGFFGLCERLTNNGIELCFGVTNIYQQNVHGGLSTHRRAGRHTGSYDLEFLADLEKLLGFEGGSLFVHTEGSWSRLDVDATSIGSVFGVNRDAAGRRAMDVTELWYEQTMFDDTLRVRLGKMDITCGFECRGCPVSFDGSAYANDETSQFLNGALVNNPTIPFPDFGLGIVVYWNPVEWWYASVGAIDAQADGRETGFRTTFHDEDYFLYLLETGIASELDSSNGSMPGTYRIGLWNDPQPKANSDSTKSYRDDVGFYLSFDQMLRKENYELEDSQGIGAFLRYGYANSKKNDITNFWSAGLQYRGLLDGRDDDVLGLGFAKGIFSDSASTSYTEDYESAVELYYSARITPWLAVSPSVQYITNPSNPDNAETADDAVVLGIRVQMIF
ncbi:MAG TPA: carbohydrate porin [Sedimentisphaerales bacterium]|nr:carbohydrate porin [Sedimentisphaerales bacterium]